MKVLLKGGPHDGRKLKDSDIYPDKIVSSGEVRVLNVESKHDKNIVDVYTFLEEIEPGDMEFLYRASQRIN